MPFSIVRNDITKMKVDAIVNTANPEPKVGNGLDKAVFMAAGIGKLFPKRVEIGTIKPGEAVVTKGYELSAGYIIHTVGTPWEGGKKGEEEIIRRCYKSVFRVASEKKFKSLAIPLIASGNYGFPKGIALRIAISEIEAFISQNDMEIYLVVFDEKAYSLSTELYGDIEAYINKNYVEETIENEQISIMLIKGLDNISRISGMPFMGARATPHIPKDDTVSPNKMSSTKRGNKKSRSLDEVVKDIDKSFMDMVFSFADQKGISDVELQKKANLDRKAFSKLKCGTTKNPSKATALALAVALKLNLDETKDLLSRAGFALSPCSKQDIIVRYFIETGIYNLYEINITLFDYGEQILGSQAG